jgi:glucose-6-phosphate isomerase
MTLPYERGLKIEEEFLRMHFSESKMKQIYEKNSVFYQTSTINICQSFLNLEYSLRQ